MLDEQSTFITAPMLRLPQIPPHELVQRRQRTLINRYRDEIPSTPVPVLCTLLQPLPVTPPVQITAISPLEHVPRLASGGFTRPAMRYIPRKKKRDEYGVGETLLGCGFLWLLCALVFLILYYFSS